MGWLVQPLLFFLARCTRNQLIRQIEFLKAENEMLRKRLPKQEICLEAGGERAALIKLGRSDWPRRQARCSRSSRYDTLSATGVRQVRVHTTWSTSGSAAKEAR